ncbi:futalosine hydrolase [Desulfolutivibrio sulfoxidireducens]|uniref:futalosine hydrolase n=1 Tax=Desulfolutivibrio sulfoxidireducens TaxID=2773299 RepID=UPI00159E4EA1|nr:futalosine hydrolase [Desulfolutivibrio sulfoxidireducens]QLA17280.1 futalosine hydrolase [Desulfolutivibrio sulfoxidireducens]
MALVLAFATVMELRAALPKAPEMPEGAAAHEVFPGEPFEIAGRPARLLVTGVGPAACAAALGRALGAYSDTTGVIQLGVAGSFDLDRAPLGSAWRVTRETWPEYGLYGECGVDPRGIRLPMARTDAGPVSESLDLDPDEAARAMGLYPSGFIGRAASLTVAGVTGTLERANGLSRRHGVLLENMEGFAAALACRLGRVPFFEMRVVSNLVGGREAAHWDLKGGLARLEPALAGLLGHAS